MRHASPLWLAVLLAASVAAQQAATPPVPLWLARPYAALPVFDGSGFGSALRTPSRRAVWGNPAALPERAEAAVALRTATPAELPELPSTVEGSESTYVLLLRSSQSKLPVEAGAAWAYGPLRLAAGYARLEDGSVDVETRSSEGDRMASGLNTDGQRISRVGGAAALALPLPSGAAMVVGAQVSRLDLHREQRFEMPGFAPPDGSPFIGPSSQVETVEANGWAWAIGSRAEMPVRSVRLHAGLWFDAPAVVNGEQRAACSGAWPCIITAYPHVEARLPARLEGSIGAEYGGWRTEATLRRVFWSDTRPASNAYDLVAMRDAIEGSVNARYTIRPGLTLALGLNQADYKVYKIEGESRSFFDQDPTRFLLLGATYERGPLVLDAAYVNGTLLSDDGSKIHLGSLGIGYRF